MKRNILTFFKGFCVGGTMLIPGVSGGSMAMILGIYDELVTSAGRFFQQKKKNALFLGLFAVGGVCGMILLASPLLSLIEKYPKPSLYFFVGCTAGSIPTVFRAAGVKKISWRCFAFPCAGALTVLLFALLPSGVTGRLSGGGNVGFLLLAAAGFITAAALVLPGISVSYFLMLLGLYDKTMQALSSLHLPTLIPLGLGMLLGTALTVRLLEKAMMRFPLPTYLIILGFILGGTAQIFPGLPASLTETAVCFPAMLSGYAAIRLLSRASASSVASCRQERAASALK